MKAFRKLKRVYYKYREFTGWTNPVLTSDLGNPNFRVIKAGWVPGHTFTTNVYELSGGWHSFDGNDYTYGVGVYDPDTYTTIITFVEVNPSVKLTNCNIRIARYDGDLHQYGDSVYIYGTNDFDGDWILISSDFISVFEGAKDMPIDEAASNYFKYFAFRDSYGAHNNDYSSIVEVKMKATVKIPELSTALNSDFSKDIPEYKAVKLDVSGIEKYYGIKG